MKLARLLVLTAITKPVETRNSSTGLFSSSFKNKNFKLMKHGINTKRTPFYNGIRVNVGILSPYFFKSAPNE